MIARIVPVKRTPRNVSVFDYKVPQELETTIQPGQLVVVELRKTKEFGIVVELLTTHDPNVAYKNLDSITYTFPLIPPQNQKFLSKLSTIYATSLATVYKTSLLPLQKRKLKKVTLTNLDKTISKKYSESYALYTDEVNHDALFSSVAAYKVTLVLVPEKQSLPSTQKKIEQHFSGDIIIWHSDLSEKEKFELWLKVRNAKQPLIILGTRSAITLPFTSLDHIIIDEEHSEQYKSYDQQPKYHARDMVKHLAEIYGSTLVYASFSPSFEMYYRIAKEKMACTVDQKPHNSELLFQSNNVKLNTIRIIEHIQKPGEKRICSITTEEKILSIGRENSSDMVIMVQRKGFATLVVCKNCGHIETSQETGLPMVFRKDTGLLHSSHNHETRSLPTSCSKCRSTILLLQGIGTEKVASYISELFSSEGISMPVYRIDDNTEESVLQELLTSKKPRILIGTEKVFSYIRPAETQLYSILDLDRSLALPEYNALEHTVHLLQKIYIFKSPSAEFILETTSAEKPIFKFFAEPDRVYREELSIRKKLGLPPYLCMIKYSIGSPNTFAAKKLAQTLNQLLTLKLTEHKISATISEIYEAHPTFQKGMHWNNILLKTPKQNVERIADMIHTILPPGSTIDVNPLSTLSP